MNIEEQVCSVEQSKRLKELGLNIKTEWYNAYPNDGMISSTYVVYHKTVAFGLVEDNEGDNFDTNIASAFTTSELFSILPDPFSFGKYFGYVDINNFCNPLYYRFDIGESSYYGKSDVDVLSKALIDLIENGTISIADINQY